MIRFYQRDSEKGPVFLCARLPHDPLIDGGKVLYSFSEHKATKNHQFIF